MTREEALVVANGNADAAGFLLAFVAYCHLLDDCYDKDKPVDDKRLAVESLNLIDELMLNPWVQQNRAVLWGLITSGFNAWLDANEWERSDDEGKKRDADVVKGIYHEVCWVTARLCGGWEHMKQLTTKARAYDHDFDKEKVKV